MFCFHFQLQIVIMSIPAITALNPMSTAVPLILIMVATMVKDGYVGFLFFLLHSGLLCA